MSSARAMPREANFSVLYGLPPRRAEKGRHHADEDNTQKGTVHEDNDGDCDHGRSRWHHTGKGETK